MPPNAFSVLYFRARQTIGAPSSFLQIELIKCESCEMKVAGSRGEEKGNRVILHCFFTSS